jgi:drug/metabolite transporter (DMT)-like permease
MSAYRDNAPQRPLSWTQKAGIACLLVGAAIVLAYIAGHLGIAPKVLDSPVPGTAFVAIAAPLIGMRRGPLSAETKRQRLLIIFVAVALCAVAAALTFYFKGA